MRSILILLAALVAVLIVALVVVVAIGLSLTQRHTAIRVARINANAERVFGLISGPQNWRTDLRDYKFFEQGGRHMVSETDRHGETITYEVVESDAPTRLKRTIADKKLPFGGSWTWNITPQGEHCSVTITEEGEVYNPVFRFVSRFVLGHTRTLDNYLAMLTAAAESQKAQSASR